MDITDITSLPSNRIIRSPISQKSMAEIHDISTLSQTTNTSVSSEQFAIQMKRNRSALADVLRLLSDEECLSIRERQIAEELGSDVVNTKLFKHTNEELISRTNSHAKVPPAKTYEQYSKSPPRGQRKGYYGTDFPIESVARISPTYLPTQSPHTRHIQPTASSGGVSTTRSPPNPLLDIVSTVSTPTPSYPSQRGTYIVPVQQKAPVVIKSPPAANGPTAQYHQACKAANVRLEEDYKFYAFQKLAVREQLPLDAIKIPSAVSPFNTVKPNGPKSSDDASEIGSPRSRTSEVGTPRNATQDLVTQRKTSANLVTLQSASVRQVKAGLGDFIHKMRNRL